MQRRIDLVAGHRRAERHFGGFGVADFADQDDVRVWRIIERMPLAKSSLSRFGNGGLADQRHRVLDRVFGS